MMAACSIRHAEPTDLARLTLIEEAADRLFPEGRIPEPETMPRAELERAHADGLLWVATSEDGPAGFAVCGVTDGLLHLYLLAVHPARGRRGIGTALVRTVLAEARARALPGVTLTTFRDLPWNAPFYERLGFRPLEEAELSPALRTILSREAAAGLTNLVAMRCPTP